MFLAIFVAIILYLINSKIFWGAIFQSTSIKWKLISFSLPLFKNNYTRKATCLVHPQRFFFFVHMLRGDSRHSKKRWDYDSRYTQKARPLNKYSGNCSFNCWDNIEFKKTNIKHRNTLSRSGRFRNQDTRKRAVANQIEEFRHTKKSRKNFCLNLSIFTPGRAPQPIRKTLSISANYKWDLHLLTN